MVKRLNPIERRISELGSDWIGEQVVRLGDLSGNVETGIPGEYYARQNNGRVIRVINSISIPPDFDARVLIRRSKIQPNVWKIAETLEDYDSPVSGGRVASHHEQHEEQGFDRLTLDRKQIKQLSVRAAGAFTIQVFGGAVQTSAGVVFINNEVLDLASDVPASGALYISIEADEDGDLSLNPGSSFAAPNQGTFSNIASPASGSFAIAYVLLYSGQTAIIDNNIRPILPLPGASSTVLFDDSAGDPEDVSTSAPSDGVSPFAARADHVHLYTDTGGGGGDAGHNHGIARWNGAAGNTTFDLPDLAAQLESVTLNGLEEDPFVYSLSSDGSQVILDSALASDTTVIAHYVLLNL